MATGRHTHIFPKVMHLFFKTEFQEDICHKKFILKQKRKHKLIDNENDTSIHHQRNQ
jgi:hypothetical protein